MIDYTETFAHNDFELQLVIKHKQDPFNYPLNISYIKEFCEESLTLCETGIVLGENWHGGMSQEEWNSQKQYIEKILFELNK